MSVANIWKLQENTAALCKIGCKILRVSAIRGSRYVWPGKLKRPPLPSGVKCWMQNIRMECRRRRIRDVRHLGGMSAEQNSGCETSGWNVGGAEFRMCCPDHWLKCTSLATSFQQPATTHVLPPSDGVSGRPVRTSFTMDSKELSSISDWFGDQKAIKTPKLNTIWLELMQGSLIC